MVDWSGPQTSRNRSHGTVKHSVKLLGVGATAPDWCAVLCSRVDQCQGGDFQGLGSGSPCGSRKAADQGDTCSGLRSEVFQVLAKRQRAVQFHTQFDLKAVHSQRNSSTGADDRTDLTLVRVFILNNSFSKFPYFQ